LPAGPHIVLHSLADSSLQGERHRLTVRSGDPGELGDRHQLHTIHIDVMYNHPGRSDLDLWRFDGYPFGIEIALDSYGSTILTHS